MMRLQKFLAEAGVASRRKAEELIASGRIAVNGTPVTQLGLKIDENKDVVSFDGSPVHKTSRLVYIMLHKPEGYVTTVKDQFDRPTVLDLVKDVNERIFPVGRLDYDTSGLLLLTNDGDLTYRLTHPSHEVEKVYEAKLYGTPDTYAIAQFRRGIVIEGKKTAPGKLEVIKSQGRFSWCRITIKEGRNRQVRKMCDAVKHPVAELKRVATGNLRLGSLEKGKYRPLTAGEIRYLKNL